MKSNYTSSHLVCFVRLLSKTGLGVGAFSVLVVVWFFVFGVVLLIFF